MKILLNPTQIVLLYMQKSCCLIGESKKKNEK